MPPGGPGGEMGLITQRADTQTQTRGGPDGEMVLITWRANTQTQTPSGPDGEMILITQRADTQTRGVKVLHIFCRYRTCTPSRSNCGFVCCGRKFLRYLRFALICCSSG